MFDFHTHSLFSDGNLIPSELVRRALIKGYKGIAITDHVDFSNLEHVLGRLKKLELWQEGEKGRGRGKDKEKGDKDMGKDIEVIKGVEISYDPLEKIGKIVKKARDFGAELIVVHGETLVEPVERGTNKTAVSNPSVDLLAHPGLISMEEAEIASDNDVYLEITSRAGHCLANGHVVDISRKANAKLLLNSDAHSPEDLLTKELAAKIATGAGLDAGEVKVVMEENPRELMKKIGNRW